MNKQERQDQYRMVQRLEELGLNYETIQTLRRISMTLRRWFELECGDGNNYASWSIERDEESDLPYKVVYPHSGPNVRYRIADREKGARKRLAAIMAEHPALVAYVQTDPRGCALYVIERKDLVDHDNERILPVDQCYTRGIAVW